MKHLAAMLAAAAFCGIPLAASAIPPVRPPATDSNPNLPCREADSSPGCNGTAQGVGGPIYVPNLSSRTYGTVSGTVVAIAGSRVTITDGKHTLTFDASRAIAGGHIPRDLAVHEKIIASGSIDELNEFHADEIQAGSTK